MATLASDSQCESKQVRNKKTTKIFIIQGAGFWILLVIPHYVVQPARPSEWRPFRLSVAKPEPKKIMTQSKSKFQLSVESNPWLNWFCLTTVCDWSRKFAPISQPIKCKTKIDRDVVTRVFPRYREFACLFCSDRPLWSLGFFPPGPPAFLPPKNCWHLFVTFSARIMYYMYIH